MKRILITGSRNFSHTDLMEEALERHIDQPEDTVVIHGGARGADALAGALSENRGCTIEIFEAQWDKYGKGAGGIRNQLMVDSGADICLAFPLENSVGTYDCIKRAKSAGIEVEIFTSL